MKGIALTEAVLILGVLIAAGIIVFQLATIFLAQQKISREEVVVSFSKDVSSIIDKAISTTGESTFSYEPNIAKYRVEIRNSTVLILDKISGKKASFSKSFSLVENKFEDCDEIYILKKEQKIAIFCNCLENGETCSDSLLCCSGYCNLTSKKCEEQPICPEDRKCPGADPTEAPLDSLGIPCCPPDKPVCSASHCCPLDKPKWCEMPKNGDPRCMDENEYELECSCIPDSPCNSIWPAHQGFKVRINEENFACDLFEVCHPDLDPIVEEAEECCENSCQGSCHMFCDQALVQSGGNLKKCKGLYIIYGLGPAAKFMKDYFWPEICCLGNNYCLHGCKPSDLGKCSCFGHTYGSNAQSLPCVDWPTRYPRGWRSDTDMSQNTCKFSDLIAHANILEDKGIHTGVCVDYSVSLTTLLRKAGYAKDEVFTTCGPGHAFNLVKFPGDPKYHVVDTRGNKPTPIRFGSLPPNYPYYCNYGACSPPCMNDAYNGNCPPRSEVYGC